MASRRSRAPFARVAPTYQTLVRTFFGPRRRTLRPRSSALAAAWEHAQHWGWADNIVGIALGWKATGGLTDSTRPSLTFYVRRKRPQARLRRGERIPKRITLPGQPQGPMTDVVELRGRIVAHAGQKVRPLQPAAEIGHFTGTRGTLGLLVSRIGSTEVLGMSCSHVLARSGTAGTLDLIEQPVDSTLDPTVNAVGALTDTFTTISDTDLNDEDLALMTFRAAPSTPFLNGDAAPTEASSESADELGARRPVTLLYGCVNQGVSGEVKTAHSTWTIDELPGVGSARFTGLVAYNTPCDHGDSGGAVLDGDDRAVLGLHVAGSSADNFGLFEPIGFLFDRYALKLAH